MRKIAALVAATVIGSAVVAGTVGIGSATPEQSAALSFYHTLKGDGVNVARVMCLPVQDHPEHPVRQIDGNAECWVSFTTPHPSVAVPVYVYEDGSFDIVDDRYNV
jgi:uncharacterized Ntn-hydrolase superfamily protein